MKIQSTLPTTLAALAIAILSPAASAAIVYADDFSGAAGTDLDGTAPDIRPGNQTWTANSLFDFNGAAGVTATASTAVRGAYLPFTLVAGFVYELQVTLKFAAVAASSADTRSLQVGFLEIAPGTTANTSPVASGSGGPAFFLRQNGTYESRADGGVTGNSGTLATLVTDPHTVRLVLDTSQAAWVLRSYLDGVQIGGAQTYGTNPALLSIGLSANTSGGVGAVGDFSNFSFSAEAVPEPAAGLLMATSLGTLALRRRRA